jgi:uncharacterized damage-inducible protein DinB
MMTVDLARTMARYNRWQNRSLYGAAATLADAERRRDRGAFFGSIHATLAHILWADLAWLNRFGVLPPPPRGVLKDPGAVFPDWDALSAERRRIDEVMVGWTDGLTPADIAGDLTYHSMASGTTSTRPRGLLLAHLFNHQTHHRGQVHAMLTAAGARPDDTDLPLLPAG